MPAWYAFFRQMILAGRRSSDKVPSLLAHSAGTRKQKRPFLCRSAFKELQQSEKLGCCIFYNRTR